MGRTCPYCDADAEPAADTRQFTIWRCDGEPGDVWAEMNRDGLIEPIHHLGVRRRTANRLD